MAESCLEPPLPQPELPEKIGKYKIDGLLEHGGMSLLYLASHPETSEPLVIKVLSPKYLTNQEVTRRFLNEAHIISLATHPNIIKLYDWGSWEHGFFIAMEYVHATSLRHVLRNHPFSLRRALEILFQIAYALCHLHAHGIVHGDLKPENILMTHDGKIKIIDFGIAQILEKQKNTHKKKETAFIGTPVYMAPEVLQNSQNYSFQSDIYSLGILTYELTLGKISHGRILLSLAPKGLQHILTKALQPDPENRYQDIVEFIRDIKAYIESENPEKDKQGPDYFFEFFEKAEEFHRHLLPTKTPNWHGVNIGFELSLGITFGNLYYDFIDLTPTKKVIFISTTPKTKLPTSLITGLLKGIVHSLAKHTKYSSSELFQAIDEEIKTHVPNNKINIALFFFDTEHKTFDYYSTDLNGFSHALFLESANKTIIRAQELVSHQEKNNPSSSYFHLNTPQDLTRRVLFLATAEPPTSEKQNSITQEIEKLFQQYHHLPPSRQAEHTLRKLRIKYPFLSKHGPALLFVIDLPY